MRQNLAAEIINCYERARQARQKAEVAINEEFKTDFLAAEAAGCHWPTATRDSIASREQSPSSTVVLGQVQSTGCFESTVARSSPTT